MKTPRVLALLTTVLTGAALLAALTTTWAVAMAGGEYRDPSGFSFTYPDGWFVAAAPDRPMRTEDLPREIRDWLAKNPVDLSRVQMLLIHEGDGGDARFLENLNVVVTPGQIPITDATIRDLGEQVPKQYQSLGIQAEGLAFRRARYGSHEVIVGDQRMTFPANNMTVAQRQVYFPGGGKTFIVTITGDPTTFAAHAQGFDRILNSFTVPAAIATGFNWSSVSRAALVGGLIGMIGGIIAVFGRMASGRKQPPPSLNFPRPGA